MNEKEWADLFETVRFSFGYLLQIVTTIGAILGGYYSFRASLSVTKNSEHLVKQDNELAKVGDKVDEQATALVKATDEHAEKVAVIVKEKTDETAENFRTEIESLKAKIEVMTKNSPSVPPKC